jgi:hypothetical protein
MPLGNPKIGPERNFPAPWPGCLEKLLVTVGDWPLNVFSDPDAAAELGTPQAIASAELHNLVFQSDYRIDST